VVYLDSLDEAQRTYFSNQRGIMASRLCEATGLTAEQRAEGLALVDEDGELTDVAMPAEGTQAHVTLLVAEFLARRFEPASQDDVAAFLAAARDRYGRFWRKSAREAGSERELARIALEQLRKLQLIALDAECARPLPALARFALGEADIRTPAAAQAAASPSLFDL
jgi:uncharacterized protein (TIGR02678 family)